MTESPSPPARAERSRTWQPARRFVRGHWWIGLGTVLGWIGALFPAPSPLCGAITFQVTFDDPMGEYVGFYDGVERNLIAAGNEWASYLLTDFNVSIETEIGFQSIGGANGTSNTSAYDKFDGSYHVWMAGAAAEIVRGVDPNGAAPDARINLSTDLLNRGVFWFDPAPGPGSVVPSSKWDAYSVLLHELGHVLGFNGWRDWQTAQLPADYQSTFDQWVVEMSGTFFFAGPQAQAYYGGPVPLTYGNLYHLGNRDPRPGADLVNDVMNGLAIHFGRRYSVSPLDLAILGDTGLAIRRIIFLAGDANGDGRVDIADFNVLKTHFGKPGDPSMGDFDGSGLVDIVDFSILKDNFGKSTNGMAPEPAASGTMALGILWLVAAAARRRGTARAGVKKPDSVGIRRQATGS